MRTPQVVILVFNYIKTFSFTMLTTLVLTHQPGTSERIPGGTRTFDLPLPLLILQPLGQGDGTM